MSKSSTRPPPPYVGVGSGGDLFFTQFSFLGFDPRGRRDRYTNYFQNNRALSLINRAYCIANPRGYVAGTNMTFAGLARDSQRADVIGFLRSQADSPLPLPKAAANAAPAGGKPAEAPKAAAPAKH